MGFPILPFFVTEMLILSVEDNEIHIFSMEIFIDNYLEGILKNLNSYFLPCLFSCGYTSGI